jgi:hypothetical protein
LPKRGFKLKAGMALSVALMAVMALAVLPGAASAACTTGGLTPAEVDICTPTAKAKMLAGG